MLVSVPFCSYVWAFYLFWFPLRNFSQIQPGGEVTRDLESGVIRPELRYYSSGPDSWPNTLHGAAPELPYKLGSPLERNLIVPGEAPGDDQLSEDQTQRVPGSVPYRSDLVDTGEKKISFMIIQSLMAKTSLRFEEEDGRHDQEQAQSSKRSRANRIVHFFCSFVGPYL